MSPMLAYVLLVADLAWLWWLIRWYTQDD